MSVIGRQMYSRHFLSLLVSVICCLILQCQSDEPQPTVNIPSLGGLRGSQMVSSSGRKFHAFRGIPYAEPPVGNLRFNVRIINNQKLSTAKIHFLFHSLK